MRAIRAPRGNSRLLSIAVVVIVIALVSLRLAGDAPTWLGWGPQTLAYASDLSVLLGTVVVSATMAWQAIPLRTPAGRDAMALSVRSQSQVVRYLVIQAVALSLVVATVPVFAALGATLLYGSKTMPDAALGLLWWLGSSAGLTALALLGALIGWWVHHLVAVVLAPAAAYLLALSTLYTLEPPQWSGLYAAQFLPWMESVPTLTSAAVRAAFWIAISTLLALLLSGRSRAAAVSALSASLAFSAAILEGPRSRPVEGALEVQCLGQDPTICTRELYSAGLTGFADIIDEAADNLPEGWLPPYVRTDDFIDLAFDDPAVLTIEPIGGTTAPTNLPDRRQTLIAVAEAVFLANCTDPSAGTIGVIVGYLGGLGIAPEEAVQPWQRPHAEYLDPDALAEMTAVADGLRTMPAAERIRWYDDRRDAIQSCTVAAADLA